MQAREAVDVIGKQQFLQQTNVYEMEQKERIVLLIVNVILRVGMQIVLGVAQGVLLGQLVVAWSNMALKDYSVMERRKRTEYLEVIMNSFIEGFVRIYTDYNGG